MEFVITPKDPDSLFDETEALRKITERLVNFDATTLPWLNAYDEPNVSKGIDNMNEINYEIKHVENFWRVFSVVTYRGKVFENFVGESATKVEAEMLMNKAKRIVS